MNRENLLHKWLNKETLSKAELQFLHEDANFQEFTKIAGQSSRFSTPEFDKDVVFKAITALNKPKQLRRLAPIRMIMRVAAILVIVFCSYLYLSNLDTTVATQMAQNTEVTLPDNSEIVLNADSKIEYNKNTWSQARELTLTGEAFFKVAKGSAFTVHTPLGDVAVLGTQFNVYARDSKFMVSCFEGVVSVSLNDKVVTLKEGMALQLDAGSFSSQEGILLTQPVWLGNESSFKQAPLSEVLKSLEAQYGIQIDASNVDIETKFTGSFTHSDLEIALQSICNPLQMTYSVLNSEQVVLNNAN